MQWINGNLIGAYALGLILLFVFIKVFYTPLKAAIKLVLNAVGGGIILVIINIAGGFLGIQIGINVFTAAVAGFFGIPGVAMMLLL